LPIVRLLELGRRNVADRLEQAAMVEPVDPLQDRVLDRLDALPGTTAADDLGLEQTDDRLGERVVVGVAAAASRWADAALGEALAVAQRQVLSTTIAVMHESICVGAIVHGLLERIEHQLGLERGADTPAPRCAVQKRRSRMPRTQSRARWRSR
jgi:hypothetical protein